MVYLPFYGAQVTPLQNPDHVISEIDGTSSVLPLGLNFGWTAVSVGHGPAVAIHSWVWSILSDGKFMRN